MADEEILGFKLVKCIANGAGSQLWEVQEAGTGRPFAMKLLQENSPDKVENKAAMKHEAMVLKQLEHPNIIRLENITIHRDHSFILMEYFRAPNLKQHLKVNPPLVHSRMEPLLDGLLAALAYVHEKGWIHRDLKPDNILLTRGGEVRLVDFSLATKFNVGLAAMFAGKASAIQGTRAYIAPETIRRTAATPATDIYSLGITLFELLTSRVPFAGSTPEDLLNKHLRTEPANPSEFNSNVTPEMDAVVAKMLKKKPKDRYQSVSEIIAELKKIKIFKEPVIEADTGSAKVDVSAQGELEKLLNDMGGDSRSDAKRAELIQQNPQLAILFEQKKAEMAKERELEKKKRELTRANLERRMGAPEPAKEVAAPPPAPVAPPPAAAPVQRGPMPGLPAGFNPAMMYPPGMMPGQIPPGMMRPGAPGMPPGMMPGMMPPGMPGMMPPGFPQGGFPPGMQPPGVTPATQPRPGQMPPGFPAAVPVRPAQAFPVPPTVPGQSVARLPNLPIPTAPAAAPTTPPVAKPAPAAAAKPAPTPRPALPADGEFMTELPDVL